MTGVFQFGSGGLTPPLPHGRKCHHLPPPQPPSQSSPSLPSLSEGPCFPRSGVHDSPPIREGTHPSHGRRTVVSCIGLLGYSRGSFSSLYVIATACSGHVTVFAYVNKNSFVLEILFLLFVYGCSCAKDPIYDIPPPSKPKPPFWVRWGKGL